jgi:single-stranded-DNA-specific exonuclease
MLATETTSHKNKRWILSERDENKITALARALNLPPLIAHLLINRNIETADAVKSFLEPEFKKIHPPELLPNIDRAAERIATAVKQSESIVLFGDYDVDGITGTTMLWHVLKTAGANVRTYIPHRVDEGYGLSTEAINKLIDEGAQLIVTIDCGGSAVEPITAAKNRNIDVIVSDHHELPAELPPAYAIVHPRLPLTPQSSVLSPYPNPDLCGAGVAYKLAWRTAQKICGTPLVSPQFKTLLVEFAALVALGTVADVVPLVGENRILVRHGLRQATRTSIAGLRALIDAAGLGEKALDATAIGFSIGPRLNAAGRMDHAREAVELLTLASGPRCNEIATWLEEKNRARQKTERDIFNRADELIQKDFAAANQLPHVLVIHDKSFHPGVVGIVASRIVEKYHRPTFILGCGDEKNETAHGSARSIPSFQLHEAIEHCRPLLLSGGGHAMAGGIKLPLANLENFRTQINNFACALLTQEHLTPTLEIDAETTLAELSISTVAHLEKFEPFGRSNPHPALLLRNLKISAPPRRIGSAGNHLQLQVSDGTRTARCVAWRIGELAPQLRVGTLLDLIVEPRIDRYYPTTPRLDLQIVDLTILT